MTAVDPALTAAQHVDVRSIVGNLSKGRVPGLREPDIVPAPSEKGDVTHSR